MAGVRHGHDFFSIQFHLSMRERSAQTVLRYLERQINSKMSARDEQIHLHKEVMSWL